MKISTTVIPFIDSLPEKLSMDQWNNIPIPIKTAFLQICDAFEGIKHLYFENFNAI